MIYLDLILIKETSFDFQDMLNLEHAPLLLSPTPQSEDVHFCMNLHYSGRPNNS
jgi:hypothetical protein